ncbi:MAG: integrase [Sphingobacteriales bacterium]|nr:integrase [Sphingobacteriales bacterium]
MYTVAGNHLNRDFYAVRLAEKWVSDLTYIRIEEGWLYLTTILDLADRKVVGWALSYTMKAVDTSVGAWKMAIRNKPSAKVYCFILIEGYNMLVLNSGNS